VLSVLILSSELLLRVISALISRAEGSDFPRFGLRGDCIPAIDFKIEKC
jgi:hypothetical protein